MRTESIYWVTISSVVKTAITSEQKANFAITWGMYWYVLTTIILMILHGQS